MSRSAEKTAVSRIEEGRDLSGGTGGLGTASAILMGLGGLAIGGPVGAVVGAVVGGVAGATVEKRRHRARTS